MTIDIEDAVADEDRSDALDAVAPRPRFGVRDLIDEAVVGMLARPARAALTALGTVLGVAALVATLGATKTAANQIVSRFDALAATEVVIRPTGSDSASASASRASPPERAPSPGTRRIGSND